MDIANPPEAYIESTHRLRLEAPNEETVERIVEIFRAWWRKQEQEELGELES